MMDDSYTYEDYLSDFELDYLGFPKEPVPNSASEEITEKESAQEADRSKNNTETRPLQ